MSSLRFLTGQGGAGFLGGAAGYFIAQTAQAVLGAVGQAAQGTQMIANPQAYLPQLQSPSNPHDVTQDQVLQQHMQQQGAFNTALAPLKFLENIPLVGAFTKLAEDATGLSQAIQNQQLAITQATEGHMRLVAANDQYTSQILRLSGQPLDASAMESGLRLTRMKRDAAQSGDPLDWQMFHTAEQGERAALQREGAVYNAGLMGMHISGQADQSSAEGYRQRAARNDPRALLFDQQGERLKLEAEYQTASAGATGDPWMQEGIDREFRGRAAAMVARQGLAGADLDRSLAINQTSLLAGGEAAQAQASFDPFNARRAGLRASRFAAMRMARSDSERAATAVSFDQQADATDFEEYHTVSNANDVSHARGAAAYLEAGQYRGEAGRLMRFVTGMQAADRLPPEAREGARHAVQQEDAAARVGIHRYLQNETAELNLRSVAAQYALRFNDDPTVGNVSTRLGQMRLELDRADPRLAGTVQATLMREERELRHQTLGLHAGGFGRTVARSDVAGDPIEQARQEMERKAMAKLFDEFEGGVGKFKAKDPEQQKNDLNKQLGDLVPSLQLLVEKLQPWAMAH